MKREEDVGRGLYEKFIIQRTDGGCLPGRKHEHCKHFVLDLVHDPFAMSALKAYAEACVYLHPVLARDLMEIYDKSVSVPGPIDGTNEDDGIMA